MAPGLPDRMVTRSSEADHVNALNSDLFMSDGAIVDLGWIRQNLSLVPALLI